MKKKRFTIFTLILTAVASALVTAVVAVCLVLVLAMMGDDRSGMDTLEEALDLIHTRFVAEYDRDRVVDGALAGMVDALDDRWSVYMNPKEYAEQTKRRQNSYVGVGLTYIRAEDYSAMNIQSVVKGGPADQGGLTAGERILAINGTWFNEENFQETVDSIAGVVGEKVSFTVEGVDGAIREVELTLARVETDPVEYEMLEGDIGYVRINNFFSRTAKEGAAAVHDLVDQGAKAILFDVRSNPGGYVDELTDLLDAILPEGPIFTERTKDGPVKVVTSDAACIDLPMAVLVSADSYSAAELFAAQMRESIGAPLIGEVTCGKGYYQQMIELSNGGAINLSTGLYTTGNGVSLIGTGVTPDILESDPDLQMEKALELLREKVGGGENG